jgi:hypothetical protein
MVEPAPSLQPHAATSGFSTVENPDRHPRRLYQANT